MSTSEEGIVQYDIRYSVTEPGKNPQLLSWVASATTPEHALAIFDVAVRPRYPDNVVVTAGTPVRLGLNEVFGSLEDASGISKAFETFALFGVLPLNLIAIFYCFHEVFGWNWYLAAAAALFLALIRYIGSAFGIVGAVYAWHWSPWLAIPVFIGPHVLAKFLPKSQPKIHHVEPSND